MLDVRWYGHLASDATKKFNARWLDGELSGSTSALVELRSFVKSLANAGIAITPPDMVGEIGMDAVTANPYIFEEAMKECPSFITDKVEWVRTKEENAAKPNKMKKETDFESKVKEHITKPSNSFIRMVKRYISRKDNRT